jgi:hypothetical protein
MKNTFQRHSPPHRGAFFTVRANKFAWWKLGLMPDDFTRQWESAGGAEWVKIKTQRRDIQRGNRHLDNLNFCVTRSTRHAKSSSQCCRWNFIAKDRENAVRKVKIAFFLKMRYPWKFCSINYCRITVSDHFYRFHFIKSVNITFYFAKVCFFPYLLLIKIVKSTGWDFQMLMYKKTRQRMI